LSLYDAFISYSHAKDKPIAAALQSVIQKLGKPWYKRRGLRVFRDDTSLSATPQLWPSIEQALAQSRYLLLLSSPESAASPWVGKEVEYWLTNKSTDTLLIGVTSGTLDWDGKKGDFRWRPAPPLPAVLRGRFPAEPKWVDLAAYRDGADPRDARFLDLGADFAAAIQGMPKEDLLSQEVRQQKRALRLAVSAAGVMLLLAVGAVTAGIIAKVQAERAERNFAAAEDTVNGLIFNIAQGLRDVEGIRLESLDKILGQVRKTVERLTATDPDNPRLMRDKAVMLDEFAKTYLAAGNLAAAQKSAEESNALLQRLTETGGANKDSERNVSVSLVRIGDVKRAQGDGPGALAAYEAALAKDRERAVDKANDVAQQDISIDLDRIADIKLYAGDSTGALKAYEESLDIRRALAAADPSLAARQRAVSVSLGKLCDVKRDAGDAKGALAACEEELAIARRLAEADPGNTELQRDVAIGLARLGGLKLSAGEFAEALAAYEEGLVVLRRLAKIDAGNTLWQRDVAIGLGEVADVKIAQGDSAGALAAYEESLAIFRRLAESDRDNSEWQRDITVALDKIGYLKFQAKDNAGALAGYEEGLVITRRLAERDPGNAIWQRDVAVGLNKLGDVKIFLDQDPKGALAAYEESLAIMRRLTDTNKSNAGWERDASISLDKIADVKRSTGDLTGALAAYEESLAIARRLAVIDPANISWQTDLVVSLYKIAIMTEGERKQAALDEAIKIVDRLDAEGKLSPAQKDWKNKLLALQQ
jgi:tetratricopeptide (TPR) repeat protein